MGKRLRFMTGLIAPLKVEPGNLKALPRVSSRWITASNWSARQARK